MPPVRITKNGVTNIATTESYTVATVPRTRVTSIEGDVVRRRIVPARDLTQRAHCLHYATGCDAYPAHTEGGHLIGLSIGGVDEAHNLVPMYADFNQVRWAAFERQIYEDRRIEAIRVEVEYAAADSPMPFVFEILVRWAGTEGWTQWQQLLMNDAPRPIAPTLTEAAKGIIEAAEQKVAEGWTVEANVKGTAGLLDTSAPRPYAALDYLYYEAHDQLLTLVLELGLTWRRWSQERGYPFSSVQRALILAVNAYHHGGYVLSDVTGTQILAGSTSHAPHVDHIVGMTNRGGPNLFSNAMVITAAENRSKGASHYDSGASTSASATTV